MQQTKKGQRYFAIRKHQEKGQTNRKKKLVFTCADYLTFFLDRYVSEYVFQFFFDEKPLDFICVTIFNRQPSRWQ